MAAPGLHIMHLYADSPSEWNCSQWRALTPADALNGEHEAGRTPHSAKLFYLPTALAWNDPQTQKLLGAADVLVFQRNVLVPEVWAAMDYWRALGKAIVVDLDDHYPDLPPSNPAHQYWIINRHGIEPEPVAALAEGLRHADALTSPSKVILADWAHVVRGYHLPNWTRRAWYAPLIQKPAGAPDVMFGYNEQDGQATLTGKTRDGSEGELIIGWGGSISHVDSWAYSGVIEALDRIFEKWPQARLKFCGHEQRLDYLFARWGADRIIRQGGVQPEHWPYVLATFDVGIAPLDTRPLDPPWREGAPVASYDERRSWLKGVEYLSAGVPWVGSDSLTYADLRRWGSLVENTPDAWFAALDRKLTHLVAEKTLAWERRRWAMRKVTFEPNANAYGDTFGRILAEKQTKHGARLPGVRYTAPIATAA